MPLAQMSAQTSALYYILYMANRFDTIAAVACRACKKNKIAANKPQFYGNVFTK